MLLALNGATIMKSDLANDVQVAQRCGFSLLELNIAKVRKFLETRTTAEMAELFKSAGVRPLSIVSLERVTYASDQWERVEREVREMSRVAGEIGCEFLVVTPGQRPAGAADGEVQEESISILEALADITSSDGVKLGFEFQAYASCSVRDLAHAWDIVAELDRDEVGLVLDTFHFHAGGSTLASIRRIKASKLFVFQVCDAENLPVAKLQKQHRLLPGRGGVPITKIWQELNAIGYERLVSVEAARPEYWERDPFEVAQEARQAIEQTIGALYARKPR